MLKLLKVPNSNLLFRIFEGLSIYPTFRGIRVPRDSVTSMGGRNHVKLPTFIILQYNTFMNFTITPVSWTREAWNTNIIARHASGHPFLNIPLIFIQANSKGPKLNSSLSDKYFKSYEAFISLLLIENIERKRLFARGDVI